MFRLLQLSLVRASRRVRSNRAVSDNSATLTHATEALSAAATNAALTAHIFGQPPESESGVLRMPTHWTHVEMGLRNPIRVR